MVRKIAMKSAEEEVKPTTGRVSKKAKPENFKLYITRVLKTVYPQASMSSGAAGVVNGMVFDIFQRIAADAGKVVAFNKKTTMTVRELEAAVGMVLSGTLAAHVTTEANKAVYAFNEERKKAAPSSSAKKAPKA